MSTTETLPPVTAELAALKQIDWAISTERNLASVPAMYEQARERVQSAYSNGLISEDERGQWLRKLENTVIERRTRPARYA